METCDTQPPSRSFTAPSDLSDVSVSCSLSNSDSRAAVADLRDGQDDVTCSANDDGSDRSCQGGVTSPDSVTEGDEQHRCCRSQGRCGPFDPSLTSGASCCSNRLFLSVVDNIVVGLLIGPLTVLYWRGTWTMLDYQLFPGNKAASGWLCMAFGNIGLMVVVYAQNVLERRLRRGAVDWRTVDWILGYHLYTYVLGLLNVCHWRGLWALIDHYTGMSPASVWITFVVGQLGLMLLRSSKNVLASPMIVNVDVKSNVFAYSTRFNVKRQHREHFFLDSLLTVFVIHQFVIAYWRGLWEAINVHLFPENKVLSGVICVVIAYCLQCVVCLIQPLFNALYRRNSNVAAADRSAAHVRRWLLETAFFFVANATSVFHWRGYWVLLDVFVLPSRPTISGALTHAVGLVGLWLLLAGHSVTQGGCFVDGDAAPEQGCILPNHYIRYFVDVRRRGRQLRKKQMSTDDEEKNAFGGNDVTSLPTMSDNKTDSDIDPQMLHLNGVSSYNNNRYIKTIDEDGDRHVDGEAINRLLSAS